MAEYIHVLEMHAVLNTLTMFQKHLHYKVVGLLCDNSVVVSAIRDRFPRSQELRTILCMLHLLLLQLDVTLIPQWIPSKSNVATDWLSRVNMSDNCHVQPTLIQALEHHFGPIEIDHFAMAANAICKQFNCYFAELGCKVPDAFGQSNWNACLNFLHPPLS